MLYSARMQRILGWVAIGLGLAFSGAAADSATKAGLVLSAATARPGETIWAGIRMTMSPQWHVYWRNPGESGIATSIEWSLPQGIAAGQIQWPPPESFVAGGVTTFVYHGEVMLVVPLSLASNLASGPFTIRAKVSWLECKEACLPGDAEVAAKLIVGSESTVSPDATRIELWRRRVPEPDPALAVSTSWASPPQGDSGDLVIEGAAREGFMPTDFLPYASEAYEVKPGAKVLAAEAGKFRVSKQIKRLGVAFPPTVPGLLVQAGKAVGSPGAVEVNLTLPASVPDAKSTAIASAPSGTEGPAPVGGAGGGLWKMLGLAFLGGLILNIMPCVLPVIALKILGFVQQSREAPLRVRRLGLVYGAGVLVSFLMLAGMVIGVKAAGGSASWGMQMQNLYFRLALTVIVMLVALNLFGLFELTLGGGVMGAAAGLASKEGAVGAFFNGVLAVALATPCTAPFLTVALGFAFTQPALVVVLIFLATGLGLAAPYVVLSWRPQWLKFLPKPGVWMQRFKVAMGFPMLATTIWLFDLTAPSFGEGGILWLGLFLALLALAAWIWGEFVQRGAARRGLAFAAVLALAGLDYGWILERQLNWRNPQGMTPMADVMKDSPEGVEWHRWTPEAVERAQQQGRPVLVDFTAKWCLTCRLNKAQAIEIPSVREKLKETGTIAFRADFTDKNPRIAEEMKRFQRAAVPLVVLFPRRPEAPAIVLPTTLTPGIVLDGLMQAAR